MIIFTNAESSCSVSIEMILHFCGATTVPPGKPTLHVNHNDIYATASTCALELTLPTQNTDYKAFKFRLNQAFTMHNGFGELIDYLGFCFVYACITVFPLIVCHVLFWGEGAMSQGCQERPLAYPFPWSFRCFLLYCSIWLRLFPVTIMIILICTKGRPWAMIMRQGFQKRPLASPFSQTHDYYFNQPPANDCIKKDSLFRKCINIIQF